jgi:hypothetical protein
MGLCLVCIVTLLDAAWTPALGEPLWLRVLRRCAEHPLRMMAAGSLLAWALWSFRTGSDGGSPTQEVPRDATPL